MPNQIIGTVNVQTPQSSNPQVPSIAYNGGILGVVGVSSNQTNPRVPAINYGGSRFLKEAEDLSLTGVQNKFVVTYQASTDSFVMSDSGAVATNINGGFF